MDSKDFKAGSYRKGYQYQCFLPEKINHSFFWTDEAINELLERASLKLGELNSFSRFVPDTDMFIIMHIFKEAVVSSRIEGTRTNLEEGNKRVRENSGCLRTGLEEQALPMQSLFRPFIRNYPNYSQILNRFFIIAT